MGGAGPRHRLLARAHPGRRPAHGPEQWTSGTRFPRSSKKVARAVNAASGRLPLVVLANLAGFDGSPESMRDWQLEFGAEIGRAVVSFDGPIVFCVVSRYDGGAFVVFSQRLNDNLEAAALRARHRAGRALAVVAEVPVAIGCDLELVEPRSAAFARAWLSPDDRRWLARRAPDDRPRAANLLWSAREAAAKVLRAGLRLDVRDVVVTAAGWEASRADAPDACAAWRALVVTWPAGAAPVRRTTGWWRAAGAWVMVIAGSPDPAAPEPMA